jgi:hypothetical protein
MNRRGGKPGPREPALHLGLSFDEAVGRFLRTDPAEVEEAVKRAEAERLPPSPVRGAKKASRKQSGE